MYQQSVLSKNKKNIIFFSAENFHFLKLKKSLYIAWASFRNAGIWPVISDVGNLHYRVAIHVKAGFYLCASDLFHQENMAMQ